MNIPFLRPNPPKLSQLGDKLREIEACGIFTNYGPVNTKLEKAFVSQVFGNEGTCMTVCNATIALMMAIRHVVPENLGERRYALMPSFTFAAAAQAAMWAGLTPLFCDIDEDTWMMSHEHVQDLVNTYRNKIAVMVPYGTFGNCLDLGFYEKLSEQEGIPVVIDAAASLGSQMTKGIGFGKGSAAPVIFSMHATKLFSVAEGSMVYSTDVKLINDLKAMANFGFGTPRISTMIGLNGKLSEVIALMALEKLGELEGIIEHRKELAHRYLKLLPEFRPQIMKGYRHPYQFMPFILPDDIAMKRKEFLALLTAKSVGTATYYSPHLAEHPYFKDRNVSGPLDGTHRVSSHVVSLPLSDTMTTYELDLVCERIAHSLAEVRAGR